MKHLFLGLATAALVLTSCKSTKYAELGDGIFADIQTTKGDIIVKLYHEATPVTVANFVSLAEGDSPFVTDSLKGRNYYDGIIFHRIIKDFMIQGGDPLGRGIGGPGYKFKDEIVDSLKHTDKGILSMANSGPTTNGSQFFITHKATPWLDGKHTIFGVVVNGLAVVDTIAGVKVGASNKPEVEVAMKHVEIVRNGKAAKKFDAVAIMGNYFEEAERAEAEFKKMKEALVTEFNTQMETAEETNSGLKILRLTNGDGQQPQIGQKVLVNYAGWLLKDGELFDSNVQEVAEKFKKLDLQRRDRGLYKPVPMDYSPDSRLVAGFREGLLSMKVGDKVRLFIPPYLGYGDRNNGPIPGGSTMVFDLEIKAIAQ